MAFNILYDTLTNPGERAINEDYLDVAVAKDCVSFILCDGLGGHGNGDVASEFVTEHVKDRLEQGSSLEDSIMGAQEALLEKQILENAGNTMKTTVTCLSVGEESARFGYVGDSRIYYFEKAKYKLRSLDHSIPQMLVNRGDIREKDIRHHEDRSRLLRVMGTEWNGPKYQMSEEIPLTKNSSFLLCSDGFWELIDEKNMSKTLKKAATPKDWLSAMEKIIWDNGRGTNMDNFSAIAVFVREK